MKERSESLVSVSVVKSLSTMDSTSVIFCFEVPGSLWMPMPWRKAVKSLQGISLRVGTYQLVLAAAEMGRFDRGAGHLRIRHAMSRRYNIRSISRLTCV